MALKYQNITRNTTKAVDGGYKPKLWLTRVADVTTWQRPIEVAVDSGDTVRIDTAHVWANGKAANVWEAKLHSVNLKGASIGDPGSLKMEWTAEVVVKGDTAEIQEMVNNLLMDENVIWLKERDCINAAWFIQIGDDCEPVECTPAFESGTTNQGEKLHTLQFKSKKKFFYTAAIDETV